MESKEVYCNATRGNHNKCILCGVESKKFFLKDNDFVDNEVGKHIDIILCKIDGIYCKSCANKVILKINDELDSLKKQINACIDQMPIVSINNPTGWNYEILGVVTGQSTTGTGVFSEFTSCITDFFGIQSGQYNSKLAEGERICFRQLRSKAYSEGGNAVIALDINYAELGSLKGMIMVCATGTAIKILNYGEINIKPKDDISVKISEIQKKITYLTDLKNYINSRINNESKSKDNFLDKNEALKTDNATLAILKRKTNGKAVTFASICENHWVCICGRKNIFNPDENIQNCEHCHTNRDYALKNWSLEAIQENTK